MRRGLTMILCLALLLCCLPVSMAGATEVDSAPLTRAENARDGMVRVYLSSLGNVSQLDVTIQGSYTVDGAQPMTLTSGETVSVLFSKSTGEITLRRGGTSYAMGREMAFRRHAASGGSGVKIAQSRMPGNLYPGDLRLTAQLSGGSYRLYPVVHVYIEYYLYGVLPYEMGDSAPAEALKAQAVAARTYTLNKMNTRAASLYDVVDTTSDQVYYGNSDGTIHCTGAVDATRGIVLMNGSSLTGTYYTASNGGQTESARNLWNSASHDYLTVKDDPFDRMNTASVQRSVTVYADNTDSRQNATLKGRLTDKARAALQTMGKSTQNLQVVRIDGITPHTPKYPSPSRLYTKLDFEVTAQAGGASCALTLTFDIFSELESALGMSINSTQNELWSVEGGSGSWRVVARRFGHGIGMSQRGAMQMGSLGYTYDQILGFYYEGCRRVQYTFTHTILSAIESGGNDTIVNTEKPADVTASSAVATVSLSGVQDSLAIRGAADGNAPVLISVVNGAPVTVLARGESWTLVRLGEVVGYAPTAALRFSGTPPATSTETPTVISQWATVHCSGKLNLRDAASYSGKVLGAIPDGSVLCVFEVSGSWARVQYGASVGWASADLLTLSGSYPGQSGGQDATAVTVSLPSGGTVNLRETASTTSRVLTTLPQGQAVTVLSNDGSWCLVQAGDIRGYIMTKYLSIGQSGTESTPEADAPTLGSGEVEAVVQTASTSLNLRAQPSTSSAVLAALPRGESIVVTARGSEWSAVRYGGVQGYVMTKYLAFPEDEQQAQITGYATVNTASGPLNLRRQATTGSSVLMQIPKGARVGVVSRGDKWTQVIYADTAGYVMTAYLRMDGLAAAAPEETAVYARVNTPSGGLNLRETPSADARVLLSIPQGTVLEIINRENGWCRVSHGGKTGYVMERYLTVTDEKPGEDQEETSSGGMPPAIEGYPTQEVRVSTGGGGLNLRETANSTAKVLAVIPDGATVRLITRYTEWSRVRWGEWTGYVMTKFLDLAENGAYTPETAWVSTGVGGLNLRETADTDASILCTIPKGGQVTVQIRASAWCKVTYGQETGYVRTQYLTFTEPAQEQSCLRYVVTPSGGLNLRETPSADARVMGVIPRGTQVTVEQEQDGWCQVTYEMLSGWVMARYLQDEAP